MTAEHEDRLRRVLLSDARPPVHPVGPVLVELDAGREVEAALLASLKETSMACAAMMRAMVKVCEPDMVEFITAAASHYNGFGARANAAIAMAETPEGYAEYKLREMGSPPSQSLDRIDRILAESKAEEAHAREVEDVCSSCGARTFSGICSAHCERG